MIKKKTYEKLWSIILSAFMAFSVVNIPSFAMVGAPAEDDAAIIRMDDFEGTSAKPVKSLGKGGSILELDDGNKVIELETKKTSYRSVALQPKRTTARDAIIGFRAMAAQTNESWHMFIRRFATDNTKYRDYFDAIGVEFKEDGGIYVIGEGGLWGANSHFTHKIANYSEGEWYNIDIFIENANSPDFDTNVHYYINGEECAVISLKKRATDVHPGTGLYFDGTGSLTELFGGPCNANGSNTGHLYLDDFKVVYTDLTANYFAYKDISDAENGTIKIEFSETPTKTEDKAKLYSPSGKEISIQSETINGRHGVYTFNPSLLSENGEYVLLLPQMNGVSGRRLANDAVVFEKGTAENNIKSIRLKNNTDEFTLFNTINEVDDIVLNYYAAPTDIPQISLTCDNTEVELNEASISGESIVIPVSRGVLANGKFVLSVDGKEYSFNIDTGDGVFEVEKFNLTDDGAGNAKLEVSANNTTYEDIIIRASLNIYNDMVLGENKGEEILLKAYRGRTEKSISFALPVDGYANATLTDALGVPIMSAVSLGQSQIPETDSWTVKFDGVASENAEVYAVCKDLNNEIVYREGFTADKDGKFSSLFRLSDKNKSGLYIVEWIDSTGKSGTVEKSFANVNETADRVNEINNIFLNDKDSASAKAGILKILYDDTDETTQKETYANRYALGITSDISNTATENDYRLASELIYNYLRKKLLTEETSGQICYKALYTAEIVNGNVLNMFDKSEVLMLDSSSIKDFYKKSYIRESVQTDITARLKNSLTTGDAADFEKFDSELLESFVLAVVKNPNGESNLKEVLNTFSKEIGIEKNGTDRAYRAVMNNNYNSYIELASVYNENNKTSDGSGNNGGSGNRGGSGTGVGGSKIQGIEKPDNNDLKIPYPEFSDLDGVEWAQNAITRLAEKGIVEGKGDYKFCPNDYVSRAELTKMIVAAFEFKAENDKRNEFNDVPDWAKEYVDIAYSNGIIKGYDDYNFGSNDGIIRQDLVTIVYRAAVAAGIDFSTVGSSLFADDSDFSDYAREAIIKLFNAGIISGKGDGIFAPYDGATRAEAAKIVYNVITY